MHLEALLCKDGIFPLIVLLMRMDSAWDGLVVVVGVKDTVGAHVFSILAVASIILAIVGHVPSAV